MSLTRKPRTLGLAAGAALALTLAGAALAQTAAEKAVSTRQAGFKQIGAAFKSINDDYGHSMGDEVLRKVGETLLKAGRETDVVCRYGGEEFVVVLLNTCQSDARNMA